MRLAVILVFAGVVCGLVYFVVTHPTVDHIDELEIELQKLEYQNQQLAERNEELRRQIVALRDDPRLAERRAREAAGMVRPDELVFQFDDDDEQLRIQVRLAVQPEAVELAGEPVDLAELPQRLQALDQTLPGARLVVEIDDDVGPVQRQQIVDLVDESPLAPEDWNDEQP